MTALLVAIHQLILKGHQRRTDPFQPDRQGRARQIVKQGGGLLEKQRQVILDPAGRMARADLAINRATLRIALELTPPGLPKTGDRVLVQRKFPRRQQLNLRRLGHRQLGFRVEIADAFHRIVEQFDPVWPFAAHRKQVKNRTAHRKFTMINHLRHANVTGRFQPQPKRL